MEETKGCVGTRKELDWSHKEYHYLVPDPSKTTKNWRGIKVKSLSLKALGNTRIMWLDLRKINLSNWFDLWSNNVKSEEIVQLQLFRMLSEFWCWTIDLRFLILEKDCIQYLLVAWVLLVTWLPYSRSGVRSPVILHKNSFVFQTWNAVLTYTIKFIEVLWTLPPNQTQNVIPPQFSPRTSI